MAEPVAGEALIEHAPGVWSLERAVRLGPGFVMPVRMSVLALADGGLAVYSPLEPSDHLCAALDALGPVRYVIAPNRFHHLFVTPFLARYPSAELWGSRGLAAKRSDLNFAGFLDEGEAPPPFADELATHVFGGYPGMSEVVACHRPSGTLLVADLLFNLHRAPSWGLRLYLWLFRAGGGVKQTKVARAFLKDKTAARDSLARVLEWPFERVLFAHGDVLAGGDVKGAVRTAFGKL